MEWKLALAHADAEREDALAGTQLRPLESRANVERAIRHSGRGRARRGVAAAAPVGHAARCGEQQTRCQLRTRSGMQTNRHVVLVRSAAQRIRLRFERAAPRDGRTYTDLPDRIPACPEGGRGSGILPALCRRKRQEQRRVTVLPRNRALDVAGVHADGEAQREALTHVVACTDLYLTESAVRSYHVYDRDRLITQIFFAFRDDRPGLIEHAGISDRQCEATGRVEDLQHRESC